jgi:hypothetical protein
MKGEAMRSEVQCMFFVLDNDVRIFDTKIIWIQ